MLLLQTAVAPCQHHSWEVWPGQEKMLLMVLNKFPWIPVTARTCSRHFLISAWGTRATRSWKVALCMAMACPCWAFCWLGQGRSVLRLGRLLHMILLVERVPPKRPPPWDRPELCLVHLFCTSECDFPAPHFAALLDCCFTLLELRVSFSQDSACKCQPVFMDTHIRKVSLTSPSTALQYRCILSELANQIQFLSPAQVIRRFCC